MERTLAVLYIRCGKTAALRINCFYLTLSFLLMLFLSACSPSSSYNNNQPEIITQPETPKQNSIVIVQPTDPPIPTTGPEPTIYLAPTPITVNDYPSCSQVSAGQDATCMIERSYCSYKKSVKGFPTFCNDAPYPSNNFTFLVWGEDLSRYNGKCLIVTGSVKLYQGKPEIIGTESSISICN